MNLENLQNTGNNGSSQYYFPSAFFSAFTTLPNFTDNASFIKEINKIFEDYRGGLSEMQRLSGVKEEPNWDDKDAFLFKPIPYCLFGEFDMAIISLIDDFSFATQHFKPKPFSNGFKYQVNTGIIPLIDVYEIKQVPQFKSEYLPQIFQERKINYPFVGIASVKLNNAMLVGIGQPFVDLINFFLIAWLDKELRGKNKMEQGYKFCYILNENLGWNELAIYMFGNSISYMQERIMTVRQFSLRKIKEYLEDLANESIYDKDTINQKILPIFDQISQDSLLARLITKSNHEESTIFDALESHPIIATAVTFGFSPSLVFDLKDEDSIQSACLFNDTEYRVFVEECKQPDFISINWKIKPGHEYFANLMINSCFPDKEKYPGELIDGTQSGKYQFQFPKHSISFSDYLDFARVASGYSAVEKAQHVLKVRSHLSWKFKLMPKEYDEKKHYRYDLSNYKIKETLSKIINDKLCIYPVPYTFKNQIENLIINYNDAITDPLMYNYFIGLRKPLLTFLEDRFDKDMFKEPEENMTKPEEIGSLKTKVKYQSYEDKAKDITLQFEPLDTKSITDFIQNWNKAYWNRYFHSYYFTEINDFNIEHHGGIQQILFTYDTIYRLICRRIYGEDSKAPFINVQVVPNISSTQFYNTINFTHLFRPAIYACECVHEAANHIIPYMAKQGSASDFKFLFDPFGQRTGEEIEYRRERDSRIRESVGPRDEFENTYLNQHFGMNAIRHIITDFSTYVLGYSDQNIIDKSILWKEKNLESILEFYHAHWLLFLVRTDLYDRENSGMGYWFFNETDFKVLFMRLNLMFYLFLDLTREELEILNRNSPSVEFTPIWENQRHLLLDFVVRLGESLEKEFALKTGISIETIESKHPYIHYFREKLVTIVFDAGWEQMSKTKDGENYCKAIEINRNLINSFYKLFCEGDSTHNIIKRLSAMEESINQSQNQRINVSFYKEGNRSIFLDPKGHLFSTSPEARSNAFLRSILYIKQMWNLSMKISIMDYGF